MLVRIHWVHQPSLVNGEPGRACARPSRPPQQTRHRAQWGGVAGRVGAAIAAAASLAAAEPLPFRLALRAFTTAGEVRVFDGRTLWARARAGGAWRPHPLPSGRVFDLDVDSDRLYVLDEAGVVVVRGEDPPHRLAICRAAGTLAVASATVWCASPADALERLTVWRFSGDGKELSRWPVQVPPVAGAANLPAIARMAQAWWLLLADDGGAVGVSLNRSQLLLAPAGGEPRIVPWPSPLDVLRQRRPADRGTQRPLPDLHLCAALLLPRGALLLLPGITEVDHQGAVSQADRLLVVNRDGTLHRSFPLPRRAIALVRDPAGPLILYQDDTLQPWHELEGLANPPTNP